ncbi:MAG: secretion activator protein, partial [Candidatus Afipia apatlaquensis]|nr:secretion activator protein [Candidatus Afipia apatlaquensis]
MVAATYETGIAKVFKDEGGYTNDPKDPGGATNWGITINDAQMYWKSNATAADVKAMPKSVAENIYRTKYAAPVCYDLLPAGFDYTVLDAGINSGIGRAIPWAAKALGLASGSKINQIVVAAGTAPDKVKLIQKYWA